MTEGTEAAVATLEAQDRVVTIGKTKTDAGTLVHYTVPAGSPAGQYEDGQVGADRVSWRSIITAAKAAMHEAGVKTDAAAQAVFDAIVIAAPSPSAGGGRKRKVDTSKLSKEARKIAEGLSDELIAAFNIQLD